MTGTLSISTATRGRALEVKRSGEVADDFWRKVRAEWGQEGGQPNVAIRVSLELFAARQSWLPAACRDYGVRVELDAVARDLVRRGRTDRERLQLIQNSTEDSVFTLGSAKLLENSSFVRTMKPFQERDAGHLLSLDHGANFSVPGAGKTTVELGVYVAERNKGRVSRMLVVAPLSAFDSWERDSAACISPPPIIRAYAGGSIASDTEILLVNYQRLTNSYNELAAWVGDAPTLLVLDEAHRMKRGRDGEWGAACLDLAFLAVRRDVLTGTPAPQHPRDLTALFDFLWPGQARKILPEAAMVPQPSRAAIESITPAISRLFVRTTKTELGLRKPILQVVPVPLDGLHREIYDSLRARLSARVATQRQRVELASWGDIVMYLLEAATNPALLPAGSTSGDPIEFRHPPLDIPEDSQLHHLIAEYASYETPAKFVQLGLMVKDLQETGRKVLIWSNFVRNLHAIERMLAIYEPAVVHGGIPSRVSQPNALRTREDEIARFRTDPNCGVLLANPAALGEGISLHDVCHDAIYLERTFNAGQYLQSVDRIHRLGLAPETETRVSFLVSSDTIDDAVAARIDQKASNLGRMLNDPGIATMALPDEDDVGVPIDAGDSGDIEALFAHLRGDFGVG